VFQVSRIRSAKSGAAAMLLEHLGYPQAGSAIAQAIEKVLAAGPKHAPFIPDMGGTAGTVDLGQAMADAL
jgi:tartrate dehydrogenase/decarboxylase / D-malate dehydrogenase